jgi:hypothetical protein
MFFNFLLEYTIRRVQGIQLELKLNRTYQLLACADDVNLLGDNIHTMKRNTKALIDASKEVDLEIVLEKCISYLLTRIQNRIIV